MIINVEWFNKTNNENNDVKAGGKHRPFDLVMVAKQYYNGPNYKGQIYTTLPILNYRKKFIFADWDLVLLSLIGSEV